MKLSRKIYSDWLRQDETDALPTEIVSVASAVSRRVASPRTNLGQGRGRLYELFRHLADDIHDPSCTICDYGAFPGTTPRILRDKLFPSKDYKLLAAGFHFSSEFVNAMFARDIRVLEMEFDLRKCRKPGPPHILSGPFEQDSQDVAICTDVIEHQMYPLSLLCGINRLLKMGGVLYLTTNSVSFIGDICKLAIGLQNLEPLEASHVVHDDLWRPHIRLYTKRELIRLLAMAGFQIEYAYYVDNGNVFRGTKGAFISTLRAFTSIVPHLRSHIFIRARKAVPAKETEGWNVVARQCAIYGIEDIMGAT